MARSRVGQSLTRRVACRSDLFVKQLNVSVITVNAPTQRVVCRTLLIKRLRALPLTTATHDTKAISFIPLPTLVDKIQGFHGHNTMLSRGRNLRGNLLPNTKKSRFGFDYNIIDC